jgi:hypothetical protein
MLRVLPVCTVAEASTPLSDTLEARAETAVDRSTRRRGVAFEGRLDLVRGPRVGGSGDEALTPSLFLGYHQHNLTVGVGFELSRLSISTEVGMSAETESATSLFVVPGLRYALARSVDMRTELLAHFDLGVGYVASSAFDTVYQSRVQVGPGVRHWFRSALAVGAAIGVRYERTTSNEEVTPDMALAVRTGTASMVGSINMMGVF